MIRTERMSQEFAKYHLGDGRAIHHFTAPDIGGPHDHPWPFMSEVLFGGYTEKHWFRDKEGVWRYEHIERVTGEVFHIDATHIHEIVSLTSGYCLTVVTAGPHSRETRFWRFDKGAAQSRHWQNYDWIDEP